METSTEQTQCPVKEERKRDIKVYSPPKNASPVELPESFYKLDSNEVKSLYKSQIEYRQTIDNVPLRTQKMRDVEEQAKMNKYPRTTLRVRLPDGMILQAIFESKETVAAVYDVIRSTLETPERAFLLCMPPRTKLLELGVNLHKAKLAPASNVMFVWVDKQTSGQESSILKKEYMDMQEVLGGSPAATATTTATATASSTSSSSTTASSPQQKSSKSNSVPKWLQKGLFKK